MEVMKVLASKAKLEQTLINRCRCCLENEELRGMWAEYIHQDGEVEIYGDMLKECYEFSWLEGENFEHICEKCVERLRSSLSFKRDILAAQEVLGQLIASKAKLEQTLINRCRCCFENEELRGMWAEYIHQDGEVEIYGDMLKECYEFSWLEGENFEHICEKCVERLRSSLSFKMDILAAHEVLGQLIEEYTSYPVGGQSDQPEHTGQSTESEETKTYVVKVEEEDEEEDLKEENQEEHESVETPEENVEYEVAEETVEEDEMDYLSDDEEYKPDEAEMEVEFLEDNVEAETSVKRKRSKPYRQYTFADLQEAVIMVLDNKLSRSEAARKYNIPIKTLSQRVRMKNMEDAQDGETEENRARFLEEIRIILTYTNAIPFKARIGKLNCAYCSKQGFKSAEELRAHTRTEHATQRVRGVENIMRPFYLNEILKVDIDNLTCTVCTVAINDWNVMFEHLKDKHDVELDLAYSKVIPYILAEDAVCCLCKKSFAHLHQLDTHINCHYTNYICGECGDTYLSASRLKRHQETHSTKRFPCPECNKVFTLDKYRQKHLQHVHLNVPSFKCSECSESFSQDYSRHLHMMSSHREKIKTITCEHCPLKFTWRPYYMKHKRLTHDKPQKPFRCKQCNKQFYQRNQLKNHEAWHVGKGFFCFVCNKKFSSKSYLQKHKATHEGTT